MGSHTAALGAAVCVSGPVLVRHRDLGGSGVLWAHGLRGKSGGPNQRCGTLVRL